MGETVKAVARHIAVTPTKMRRVIRPLVGMKAQQAMDLLSVLPQESATIVSKLIKSAVANADEKGLDTDALVIVSLTADEGPGVMPGKGWRAGWGSRGRYRPIRKRSSHLTVVLEERI